MSKYYLVNRSELFLQNISIPVKSLKILYIRKPLISKKRKKRRMEVELN